MPDAGGSGVALARSIARTSRPAGSESERRARAECAAHLEARGFAVREQSFEYSTAPGRWGTAITGAYIAAASFAAACAAGAHRMSDAAWLSVSAPILGLLFGTAAMRWGTRFFRGYSTTGVNLVGRRGVPTLWVVAHLDTKGQPVSLLMRAGGVVLIALGWLVALGGWIAQALGGAGAVPVLIGGLVAAAVGALPLAGSVVLDRGTGALDNASGIATIVEAIDRLDPDCAIGAVVTTAEELALAGARAWAASWPEGCPRGVALNCDGLDDEGEIVCVLGRDRQGRLARAIERARPVAGTRVRVRRTLPGVLFDSVALAQAGWDTMTVTRGTLRSLARVHTAGDTLAGWQGRGVAGAAAFVAAVAGAIVAEQHDVQHANHPARREE